MLSRTLFTLALLSTGAMGGIIQNIKSSDFLTRAVTLDPVMPANWEPSCTGSGGDPQRQCTFWAGVYTYDSGQGVVIGHLESGTRWTVSKLPSGYYQVKNVEGKCWTQDSDRGNRIYLYYCQVEETSQEWFIPGI